VEVAPVAVGTVHLVHTLSGTLRANADFMEAPWVSGQLGTGSSCASPSGENNEPVPDFFVFFRNIYIPGTYSSGLRLALGLLNLVTY